VIYIFCKFSTATSGTEMARVASGSTIGRALEALREQYRAGVAIHHPHFGRELFYCVGWQGRYLPLVNA
jgi:hypothetical protein